MVLLSLAASGCGGTQSANQALDKALAANGGSRDATGRVSGRVTIDGHEPPEQQPLLLAILYDSSGKKHPPIYTLVNADGTFQFSTYENGDGVPVGSYVLLFARLSRELMGRGGYHAPDGLNNLYNDPDKNQQDPQFKIDVTAGSKTERTIDLRVEGQEPVTTPGPHAITDINR